MDFDRLHSLVNDIFTLKDEGYVVLSGGKLVPDDGLVLEDIKNCDSANHYKNLEDLQRDCDLFCKLAVVASHPWIELRGLEDDDLVDAHHACPGCNERRQSWLCIADDDDDVTDVTDDPAKDVVICQTCGKKYILG